jgi:hypothetical protein
MKHPGSAALGTRFSNHQEEAAKQLLKVGTTNINGIDLGNTEHALSKFVLSYDFFCRV